MPRIAVRNRLPAPSWDRAAGRFRTHRAPVAQWIEQWIPNPCAASSILAGGTRLIKGLWLAGHSPFLVKKVVCTAPVQPWPAFGTLAFPHLAWISLPTAEPHHGNHCHPGAIPAMVFSSYYFYTLGGNNAVSSSSARRRSSSSWYCGVSRRSSRMSPPVQESFQESSASHLNGRA